MKHNDLRKAEVHMTALQKRFPKSRERKATEHTFKATLAEKAKSKRKDKGGN